MAQPGDKRRICSFSSRRASRVFLVQATTHCSRYHLQKNKRLSLLILAYTFLPAQLDQAALLSIVLIVFPLLVLFSGTSEAPSQPPHL